MAYKYNITHTISGKKTVINFKNKDYMLQYLDNNQDKINELERVYINFKAISLPLKATVWNINK